MTPQEIENDHRNLELLRERLYERLSSIGDENQRLQNESDAIRLLLERINLPRDQNQVPELQANSLGSFGASQSASDRAEKNSCVPTKAITRSW